MVSVSTVAEAAMAPAMISLCTIRLCTRASIRPARNCDRYRMPITRTTRPAMLRKAMRRVRLDELWMTRNCQPRRRTPSARSANWSAAWRCAALAASSAARATAAPGRAVPAWSVAELMVRSSTRVSLIVLAPDCERDPACGGDHARDHARPTVYRKLTVASGSLKAQKCLGFLEAIADSVQRLDHLEIVVRLLELLAQPLD